MNHATLHQHIYAEQALRGDLWKNLRYQKQKTNRYVSGRDGRWQIPSRRPLSEQLADNEGRKQVCHLEYDTDIGANQKQANIKVSERKSE